MAQPLKTEYLMFCPSCVEYTLLHDFDPKVGRFRGEYSLLHNAFTESDELLCRFLLAHTGHLVRLTPNRTDDYGRILRTARRFAEADIDKYVEASLAQKQAAEQEKRGDHNLGKLQLAILIQYLEQEQEEVRRTPAHSASEHQVLLGQELGLRRSIAIARRLVTHFERTYGP
ncbi:hypothetical protein [Calditerricola satsumensis]|uniref:Uncharacterized protein n=1 Tax=Calditerricola satsumensis TaxID=373054 RepID=A0A8J3FCC7_9BACI|nr:hypothetical protein [Calditerricola satsumensis]GGJ99731.1 hypothetical protein GCM10007043_12210 [Calditerricola satsumensis]